MISRVSVTSCQRPLAAKLEFVELTPFMPFSCFGKKRAKRSRHRGGIHAALSDSLRAALQAVARLHAPAGAAARQIASAPMYPTRRNEKTTYRSHDVTALRMRLVTGGGSALAALPRWQNIWILQHNSAGRKSEHLRA